MSSSPQVMPQLLNYLKADRLGRSVDWGILAVFTCAESCSLGTGYTEEFVWSGDPNIFVIWLFGAPELD